MQESPVNIQVFWGSFASPGYASHDVRWLLLIHKVEALGVKSRRAHALVVGTPTGALFRRAPVFTASISGASMRSFRTQPREQKKPEIKHTHGHVYSSLICEQTSSRFTAPSVLPSDPLAGRLVGRARTWNQLNKFSWATLGRTNLPVFLLQSGCKTAKNDAQETNWNVVDAQ